MLFLMRSCLLTTPFAVRRIEPLVPNLLPGNRLKSHNIRAHSPNCPSVCEGGGVGRCSFLYDWAEQTITLFSSVPSLASVWAQLPMFTCNGEPPVRA